MTRKSNRDEEKWQDGRLRPSCHFSSLKYCLASIAELTGLFVGNKSFLVAFHVIEGVPLTLISISIIGVEVKGLLIGSKSFFIASQAMKCVGLTYISISIAWIETNGLLI